MTPILALLPKLMTMVLPIVTAYKTVKEVNATPSKLINQNLAAEGKAGLSAKELQSIPPQNLNALKRQVAIDILKPLLLPNLQKRGGNEDDLGVIVDFACVVFKLARGKA